ncbi:sugar ABC transporter substrate-binding protein [Dactylosporangium aurantiacum]|uniref:Sugar ABC transporter substrate-binding protein n=1 Tax=Dactylosporangium aurantiacum TaxID=35754 RepID=A0A9Q9MEE5_9ACTN|nr:sugar ABC transporter substrate-binding protein [Dactylosporangium aurantiacum]MDG6110089.1 sugar ABC transporter substrate-binding protein [Dactylosporangium aurantiacum]UWZ51340.1 sugar ABC transporter substrate-binding protein [Dactylosporangium aurantiacum]
MNRVRRLAVPATVLAVAAATLTGCGDAEPGGAAAGAVKVGLITKFPVDFYDTMVDAVKQYDAAHADVEVVYGQGKSGTDDEGEIAIIENMITQGVKAIAITPTSPNVQGALDKAVKAGIKVVLIDNDIPGWTGKSSVVATDNLAGGKLAGQWLAKQLPAGASIAVLQGRLGNPSLDDRVKGLKDGLGGAATIVAEPATDCDETKGLNAAQDILTAHPDVTAIYGACGPPITGALQAVKASGKKPIVVGFDASPQEILAIEAGTQAASVAQFPAKMGTLGIETAVNAAKGQSVPSTVDTGTEMVTKDNVAKFK